MISLSEKCPRRGLSCVLPCLSCFHVSILISISYFKQVRYSADHETFGKGFTYCLTNAVVVSHWATLGCVGRVDRRGFVFPACDLIQYPAIPWPSASIVAFDSEQRSIHKSIRVFSLLAYRSAFFTGDLGSLPTFALASNHKESRP